MPLASFQPVRYNVISHRKMCLEYAQSEQICSFFKTLQLLENRSFQRNQIDTPLAHKLGTPVAHNFNV